MVTAVPQKKKNDIHDVVDELLALPEECAHLCTADMDDGSKVQGYMRFLLNREVLELYRTIVDSLEISRTIPDEAHPGNIQTSDVVVLFLVANDEEIKILPDSERFAHARTKAAGWYQKQKAQISNDAMFVAMSMYNTLNVVPTPYSQGEIAFQISFEEEPEDKKDKRIRELPSWMQGMEAYQIPEPDRKLGNRFEMRLKQLLQISQACGTAWTLQFRNVYEKGLAKTIALAEERDEHGFQSEPASGTVHAKSRAKNKDKVDES